MRYCGKILYNRTSHIQQYCSYILHTGYIRLQAHIQNVKYVLLFHSNNGYTNAPQCHVSAHIGSLVIYCMTTFVCSQISVSLHTSCSVQYSRGKKTAVSFLMLVTICNYKISEKSSNLSNQSWIRFRPS